MSKKTKNRYAYSIQTKIIEDNIEGNNEWVEMYEYAHDTCKGRFDVEVLTPDKDRDTYYFELAEDAIAFKLRWG